MKYIIITVVVLALVWIVWLAWPKKTVSPTPIEPAGYTPAEPNFSQGKG